MEKFTSLKETLETNDISITVLAQYISNHIKKNWQEVLFSNKERLIEAYHKGGDLAYGTYMNLLLSSLHKEMSEEGLQTEPRLPGDLNISREWGEDERNRQRWIWSTIKHVNKGYIGTIVTIIKHDHTEFRIPQPPSIFSLEEIEKESVIEALSRVSSDFKQAKEHKIVMEELFGNEQGN